MGDRHGAFKTRLVAAGGELLQTTNNPYEVMRFRTKYGIGVVYSNKAGRETWNKEALQAAHHLEVPGNGSLAAVVVVKRKGHAGENERIIERDGPDCFFCLEPLGDDATREHLVAVAHGGPNHISNKFLAHARCNHHAGHLSAPEKIRIREEALHRRWIAQAAKELACPTAM